jgi:hypothetical protein
VEIFYSHENKTTADNQNKIPKNIKYLPNTIMELVFSIIGFLRTLPKKKGFLRKDNWLNYTFR